MSCPHEFQAQALDGSFVPSLGNPELADRVAQLPAADAHLTDGMSEVARDSFALGLAFSRLLARWSDSHPLHESKDAGFSAPSLAQLQGESRGETR